MALPFYNWSRTAASNASADSTINWAEGQAPSSVNDSGRAMMASTAAYRDDVAGAITTGGSATAYTVASYQVFDTLAHLNGQMIAFVPHATNTNAVGVDVTLNVDGLGAKSIRAQPNLALPNGSLVLGTPYVVTYNNSDAVFYLRGLATNPYNIPIGGMMPYTVPVSAPNSSFVFPYGQAVSRTTYATYFALVATVYGVGDGSTTFNIPDLRGRVPAGKDDMGGSAANRLTTAGSGLNGVGLGTAGGGETHTLTIAEMPAHFHTAGISDPGHSHSVPLQSSGNQGSGPFNPNTTNLSGTAGGSTSSNTTGVRVTSANNGLDTTNNTGGGNAHAIVQPTIVCNYILRII